MQQYQTRSSSNTQFLVAALGIGALAGAYALSSPRRRAALVAAGESALRAGESALRMGSDLAATSAAKVRSLGVMPAEVPDTVNRLTSTARNGADHATTAAAEKLQDALDRATDRMQDVLARMREFPDDGRRWSLERARNGLMRTNGDDVESTFRHRGAGRGVMIAAAAIGAGIYAMQRYGASDYARRKLGADERGVITVEKTLFIDAPIEQVFDAWCREENFPRFMSNVKRVEPLGADRSRWTVRGPAGVGVQFESMTRKQRPTELSWQTVPGSTVDNEGRVTLVPEAGGTRATVQMSYRPPAGALGQAVSALFGADPKQEFDDDLQRMKEFIEQQRGTTLSP